MWQVTGGLPSDSSAWGAGQAQIGRPGHGGGHHAHAGPQGLGAGSDTAAVHDTYGQGSRYRGLPPGGAGRGRGDRGGSGATKWRQTPPWGPAGACRLPPGPPERPGQETAPDARRARAPLPAPAGRRQKNYRRLWEQIKAAGRDGGPPDASARGHLPGPELSVEELTRMIARLPPDAPAVAAAAPSLQFLDSRAFAALMKDLAKQGHVSRAMELFDWVKDLSPAHELAALADVYSEWRCGGCGGGRAPLDCRRRGPLAAQAHTL